MRTRRRTLATLLAAVLPALAAAACSGASGAVSANAAAATPRPAAAIVIGASLPLTGSLRGLGGPLEAGYRQEIADVNARGGISVGGGAEKLTLVVLDNGSDPGAASAQATALVRRDHAVALLGSATPQLVLPAAVAAEQLGVPFLTSLMPAEAFASGDKTGWTYAWDLFFDERQQAAAVARALAAAPGDKKVALFTDDEPDSVLERPLYAAAFEADGLDLVGDYTFPVGADVSSFVKAADASGAELLAGQLSAADGGALARQLASSGFRPRAAFLAGTSDAGYQPPSLGGVAAETLSAAGWSPGQASPGQLARVAPTLGRTYAGRPQYAPAALGYAVAEVLTDALAAAGSTKPGPLTAAIARTDAPTTAGPITFSPSTHTAIIPYPVTQVSG